MRTRELWGRTLDETVEAIAEDDDGLEYEGPEDPWLPAHWVVCDRCHGDGTHVDPRVDGNGFTMDEWHEMGREFQDDYRSGRYDVTCSQCGGRRVMPELDENVELLPWQAQLVEVIRQWNRDEAEYQAEVAAERRMGA